MDEEDKVRENRLRRMAQRQGFMLQKSRRRDARAIDYGFYRIIEPSTNFNVFPSGPVGQWDASLDEIEDWLSSRETSRSWYCPRCEPERLPKTVDTSKLRHTCGAKPST